MRIDINFFIISIVAYLLMMISLTTIYSAITQDIALAKIGFKIAIVLISLDIVMCAINNSINMGMVISISLMTILFYLMNTENILFTTIAYIVLCISISIIHRPRLCHVFHSLFHYVKKIILYSILTAFFLLIFHNYLASSIYIIVIVVMLITAIELLITLSSTTIDLNSYLLKRLRGTCITKIRILKLLDMLTHYAFTKTRNTSFLVNKCLNFINILISIIIKIESSINRSFYMVSEVIATMIQNIAKAERRIENVFHRALGVVEMLQYKMEHSFILLLFLTGLLLLIAIIFYILLLAT